MGITKYTLEEDNSVANVSFRLLSAASSRYEGDWNSIKHTHYFMELFYVKEGHGSFVVEDETFPIGPKDLIIINPHVSHTEVCDGASPVDYYVLGVEGLSSSFGNDKEYTLLNCRNRYTRLEFYFSSMIEELENKEHDYQQVCHDLLEVLILQLIRITNSTFEVVPTQKANRECSRIKKYIDSNYKNDVTLEELAQMAHLNKYYFVHTFTKSYGMSPMNYLIAKRLEASKELLRSTDHSIAQIAQITGFSSQSYFAQSFRKNCGMTAGSYRKMSRSGFHTN